MASEAVDGQRVSDWERGYNKPSERYLQELVIALELTDVSYFYETPEKPDETPLDVFADADLNARLGRMEKQLSELHDLLVGDGSDAEGILEGIASRLLQAAGSPPQPAADPTRSPRAGRPRKRA